MLGAPRAGVFVALRIRHFDSFVYFVTRASRWRRT
jgi:hypothetical protein